MRVVIADDEPIARQGLRDMRNGIAPIRREYPVGATLKGAHLPRFDDQRRVETLRFQPLLTQSLLDGGIART